MDKPMSTLRGSCSTEMTRVRVELTKSIKDPDERLHSLAYRATYSRYRQEGRPIIHGARGTGNGGASCINGAKPRVRHTGLVGQGGIRLYRDTLGKSN